MFLEYSDRIISTLLESFLLSLVLVALVLLWLDHRLGIRKKIPLLIASFWGPLVMLGLIAVLKIPLGIVGSMFAAVLVGMTGDNAIQYIFAASNEGLERGVRKRAGASVQLGILLSLASLSFLGLSLVPMKILGALFFFGFLATLCGDLWLLKACLKINPADQ